MTNFPILRKEISLMLRNTGMIFDFFNKNSAPIFNVFVVKIKLLAMPFVFKCWRCSNRFSNRHDGLEV